MKKVYLLAILLASSGFYGCLQFRKCDEAGKEDCDKSDKFENSLKCKWDEKGNDNRGKCVKAPN